MNIKIFDNGGETFDRYTVIYMDTLLRGRYDMLGMSEHPFHPQGFGQHGEIFEELNGDYSHLGEEITFTQLPEDCQQLVTQDLSDE